MGAKGPGMLAAMPGPINRPSGTDLTTVADTVSPCAVMMSLMPGHKPSKLPQGECQNRSVIDCRMTSSTLRFGSLSDCTG